jgi:prolyl-tRNA editing enzyme YbaK/EbsC (Cys-tRNA(Pro) deacylase)
MSKSLRRVEAALEAAGLGTEVLEMPSETRTAVQAAQAAGCEVDQIAKSIVFQGAETGRIFLFVTAGGRMVSAEKAAALAGEPLTRADANEVRRVTGFAIGGVAPVGHLTPIPRFFDARLCEFPRIWAAAGTPRHIFAADPHDLRRILDVEVSDFTE